MKLFVIACVLLAAPALFAADTHIEWNSPAVGSKITGVLRHPAAASTQPLPTIVYLQNLSTPRLGQEGDDSIINDLLHDGDLVLVLDYKHHANAVTPQLNVDVLKLRIDLGDKKRKSLLVDELIDPNHLFFLPEGFRLKRNVEFGTSPKRTLGMDVIYPSQPKLPVPTLMEFTCDNVDRMGGFSLLFCHDTLLEGATLSGFATAMADHPVDPPYKGLDDPMPDVLYRAKAAIRALRSQEKELGLSDKVGVIGFSRGGPIAAMLAVSNDRPELEGNGEHADQSSRVDAALVHGNRYDYLDLLPTDPMIGRFAKAWGPKDSSSETWAAHGAQFYLKDKAAPMFLNTSNTESPEYQHGLAELDKKLTSIGVEHQYRVDPDGRGHQVSTDPKTLAAIYAFFHKHLDR